MRLARDTSRYAKTAPNVKTIAGTGTDIHACVNQASMVLYANTVSFYFRIQSFPLSHQAQKFLFFTQELGRYNVSKNEKILRLTTLKTTTTKTTTWRNIYFPRITFRPAFSTRPPIWEIYVTRTRTTVSQKLKSYIEIISIVVVAMLAAFVIVAGLVVACRRKIYNPVRTTDSRQPQDRPAV